MERTNQTPGSVPTGQSGDLPVPAGTVVEGRYRIVDEVGSGGMGVVYRAEHVRLAGRPVALKMLRQAFAGTQDLRPRFEREAHALAALSHPNVVAVTDYGVHEGLPYLTMELIEGQTLRELIDQGPLPIDHALDIARQVLEGLAFAHASGLAHRDLKPANILLQPLGGDRVVAKILDFGFAKFLEPQGSDRPGLSRTGIGFGTPAYMSPEQATGGATDARSDVYSMGVLLFELLTGTQPFEGEIHEMVHHHLVSQVPPPSDRRPGVRFSPELEAVIVKAMAKKPPDRYADAGEMLAALEAIETATTETTGPAEAARWGSSAGVDRSMELTRPIAARSAVRSVPDRAARGRTGAWLLVVAVVALAGVAVVLWQDRWRGAGEERAAAIEPSPPPPRPEPAATEGAEPMLSDVPVGAAAEPAEDPQALGPPAPGEELAAAAEPSDPEVAAEGAEPPAPPEAEDRSATGPPEPAPADVAAERAAVVDPWEARAVPVALARLRRRVLRGPAPNDDTIRQLREYARAHRTDERPGLLLGHAYVRRSWLSDAVERYQLAHRLSPGARGDARMLRNLVWMVGEQGAVARRAGSAIATIYGAEALEAIDRALAAPGPDADGRRRLEELRQRIGSTTR